MASSAVVASTVVALRVKREDPSGIRVPRVTTQVQGRPPATSHAAIESIAFSLFEEHGFEATTMDDIAAAVGVGRRTLFRYYPSKNDIPWGQFDESLVEFRRSLNEMPPDRPLWESIR